MADKKFDLGDYVEVKDRIKVFYELFGQGRLVTANYELTREPDDKPKVIVTAYAYRTTDDPHPGVGTSWMYLPGKTSYTLGSEIENVETSAWGRAIGALGILIDKSIASANEIADKKVEAPQVRVAEPHANEPILEGPFTATGKIVVRKSGVSDGFLRQGPDGAFFIVAFSTVEDKTIPQVRVSGALAADVYDAADAKLDGLVCTLSGDLYRVPWSKDGKAMPAYQRLELRRIVTAGWTLPVPEAPSIPLFPEDEAQLDALLP
jgi:hypothetical protein